jgi:hypothetical protein
MVTILLLTSRPSASYSEASVLIERAGLLERDCMEAVAEKRRELCLCEVWESGLMLMGGGECFRWGVDTRVGLGVSPNIHSLRPVDVEELLRVGLIGICSEDLAANALGPKHCGDGVSDGHSTFLPVNADSEL